MASAALRDKKVTTLYLIRHGSKDKDTLTPEGLLEADALAPKLKPLNLTHIYSSPANRAQQTAKPTCEALHTTPKILPWLMEADWLRITQAGNTYCIWDIFGETIRCSGSPFPTMENWSILSYLTLLTLIFKKGKQSHLSTRHQ